MQGVPLGTLLCVDLDVASIGRVRVRPVFGVALLTAEANASVGAAGSGFAHREALRSASRVRHILERACTLLVDDEETPIRADDLAEAPHEIVTTLWRAYAEVCERAHGEFDVERLREDNAFEIERYRARHAAELVAFYGFRAALDATHDQILYFHALRGADRERT